MSRTPGPWCVKICEYGCNLYGICGPEGQMLVETDARLIAEVRVERARQDDKWGQQNHPNGTGRGADVGWAEVARRECDDAAKGGYIEWRHILSEEVAEAFAEADPARLREELIQVAAVCVAWCEAIDRAAGRGGT